MFLFDYSGTRPASFEVQAASTQKQLAGVVRACRLVISTLSKDGVAHEPCDADMLEQVSAALSTATETEEAR